METLRYDVLHGERDPRYDVVCPLCCSAIGYPCTVKKLDGREMVPWIHDERIRDGVNPAEP
jgi:hypothetical protein